MSEAPSFSPETLRTLHRIHRQRNDLKSRLDRGPRQVQAARTNVVTADTQLQDGRERLKQSRMAVDQKQLQLRSREARVDDLKVKLNQAKNNREFQAFKEQIAADQQANSVLADEILEGLEGIDALQLEIKRLQGELEQKKTDCSQLEQQVSERTTVLGADLSRVDAELASTEALLPDDMRREYLRLVAGRGEEALAPVDGDSCGGCYQTLTAQIMNRLYLKQLVVCPSCGALLYIGEERGLSTR
jgi:uncharacterized protein